MTIVGTRPEIIRLSRVIAKLDIYCDHILVHTGQNYDYELNEIFFEDMNIRKPDSFLNAACGSAAETIGEIIKLADRALEEYKPEAVLVLGDTNSCLAAISAKRRKIPIFHMEAGNRCFDFRVPEEINRRIVDHVADINLTYSKIAREYLIREGLPPDQIIVTGSPMREVLLYHQDKINNSDILSRLGLQSNRYFLISAHREENVDSEERVLKLFSILSSICEKYNQPIIVSTHPRTKKKIDQIGLKTHPLVMIHKPFGFSDYIKLQIESRACLSDSGTITEESSILNFPALNIRETHERPEGMEEGAVMLVGLDEKTIMNALDILKDQPRNTDRILSFVNDYKPTNVSDKVLRLILSYTDYVNRKTWRKD
jgi:UDP-N-acetylglucosamine 2-epimerase (non-hydrolysing)